MLGIRLGKGGETQYLIEKVSKERNWKSEEVLKNKGYGIEM